MTTIPYIGSITPGHAVIHPSTAETTGPTIHFVSPIPLYKGIRPLYLLRYSERLQATPLRVSRMARQHGQRLESGIALWTTWYSNKRSLLNDYQRCGRQAETVTCSQSFAPEPLYTQAELAPYKRYYDLYQEKKTVLKLVRAPIPLLLPPIANDLNA
jgi:hypothetical protein